MPVGVARPLEDLLAEVDRALLRQRRLGDPAMQVGNAILSRWPILESGEWDDTSVSNRDFAWARIDIPGPRDLWVVSVHLLTASGVVAAFLAVAELFDLASEVNRTKSLEAGRQLKALAGQYKSKIVLAPRPNKDVPNAVPMPESGAFRPD